MTTLPVPPNRPVHKIRARLAFTPGGSPSYQSRIFFTFWVTRMGRSFLLRADGRCRGYYSRASPLSPGVVRTCNQSRSRRAAVRSAISTEGGREVNTRSEEHTSEL